MGAVISYHFNAYFLGFIPILHSICSDFENYTQRIILLKNTLFAYVSNILSLILEYWSSIVLGF
jgi:hypothetical protein